MFFVWFLTVIGFIFITCGYSANLMCWVINFFDKMGRDRRINYAPLIFPLVGIVCLIIAGICIWFV